METDNNQPDQPVLYYGKKMYSINPLIAKKVMPIKNKPDYNSESVEENRDR